VTDYAALPNDDWETVVSAGIALAQDMDGHRWQLGDLAGLVEKRYGTDALGTYASEIGMARKATLKEYRRVAARYTPDIRMAFSEALSWSHYQAACRAKDDAELFLARAADDGLTVAALARQIAAAIGARVPPVKLWEGEADTEKLQYSLYGAVLYLRGDDDFQWADLPSGARVIVKVYAAGAV
jgi:hypothetical protein